MCDMCEVFQGSDPIVEITRGRPITGESMSRCMREGHQPNLLSTCILCGQRLSAIEVDRLLEKERNANT